ncbi:MAG: V-type ATP synthase subunit D [Clostridia bacterium]|nr:V-type ATP synthase subunit D [Clostridia bacterium]
MARLNVNPTRMELRRLKNRLKTAVRGHKLLKDKSDETIRQFMLYIKENKRLREEVENEISLSLRCFLLASAVTSSQVIEEAVAMPGYKVELETDVKNVMSVSVPVLSIKESARKELYPYSFASVTSELDSSISGLSVLLVKMLKLAEVEKTCNMLADEIEKNRRRVNALEYVMIPQLQETIKYITMKLDENERANTIRLMKVKSMIEARG